MINEYNNPESAKLLLNVALTRAKMKLYIVANCNFIKSTFKEDTLFRDVLRQIVTKGKEVKSTEIISDLKDENFEEWISKLNSLKNRPENYGISYSDQEFWPAFHNDLAVAENEIIIFSPFLTAERFSKLHLIFTELLSKGVKIFVITLPPNEQPVIMQGSKEVMTKLKELGVTVKFRQEMHEKIALIDRKIKWIGSLNILSHNTRKEYMERIEGENSSKELFDKFNLDDLLMKQNINGEICPICNSNYIGVRFSFKNKQYFYCCSSSECHFTANIKTRNLDELRNGTIKTKSTNNYTTKINVVTPTKNHTSVKRPETGKNLFGEEKDGKQWETPLTFWSSVKLAGYSYSEKKKAWWKKK